VTVLRSALAVVLDDYQDVALSSADWSQVRARCRVHVVREHISEAGALAELLQEADVVVAMRERTPFTAALLDRLPKLRLLVTTGMDNPSIDLDAAARRGVIVCGTRGSPRSSTELPWALVMNLMRNVVAEDAGVRAGRWQLGLGRQLAGATIGLVGLGSIGQRMCRYAHAFDMNVLAWSANLTPEGAAEHGATWVTKDDLFARSDVVSIHVKLSDRTRGLVGRRELTLLGPDGLLVNAARGPIVDEQALVEALQTGTIAGAAIDVFDVEPLPLDHPLRRTPNTILTPHIAYVTREVYAAYFRDVVADIEQWLAGAPVRMLC
jgi:phosphoglycerate dehydrogenase-like enzyme